MKTIDIRINQELIKKYKPCPEGIKNFKEYYTDISIEELINSTRISYVDKTWLLKKIVPMDLLVLWAIDSSFSAYDLYLNKEADKYEDLRDYHYADFRHVCDSASEAMEFNYKPATRLNAKDANERREDIAGLSAQAAMICSCLELGRGTETTNRLQALLYFIETEGN